MGAELSPKREEELIKKIADLIVRNDMETPALVFIGGARPISYIGTELLSLVLYPFSPVIGNWGEDVLSLFNKRENVDRLMQKIEELSDEKERKRKMLGEDNWKKVLKRFFWGN